MSGSPNTTNMLPLPVFFSSSAMCRSGFMRAFRIGSGPRLRSSEAWASKLKAQAISTSKRASDASRAAATRSARGDGAELRADQDRRRGARARLASMIAALGADYSPGQGSSDGEL